MPLAKDDSIAGDSTMSFASPSGTPVIKRAAVTYGRRREVVLENDPASSGSRSTTSSSSRQSIYRTGLSDMEEEIPPNSEPPHVPSDLDDNNGGDISKDASSPFRFAWKDKLKEIDEQEDSDMDISIPLHPDTSPQPIFDQPLLLQRRDTGSSTALKPPSNNPLDDVLGESFSALTSPPLSAAVFGEPSALLSTKLGAPFTRVDRPKVVIDSDSEQNITKDTNSPTAASPPLPRSITTPYLRSSTTPPTSDDDMPAHIMPKNRSKDKGKSATRTVPPLLFNEQEIQLVESAKKPPAGKKDKKTKTKAPTRKELAETTRDRLRISAEQKVSIPKAEGSSSKYSIQSFFASLADKPTSIMPKVPSSDPIVSFSSPAERIKTPPRVMQPNHQLPDQPMHVLSKLNGPTPNTNSNSDDPPEVSALVSTNEERKKTKLLLQKQKELIEAKKRALAQQVVHPERSDSDNDLEVVYGTSQNSMQATVKREEDARKSGTKPRVSEGRKRQLRMGGISLAERKAQIGASAFEAPMGHSAHEKPGLLNQTELSKVLSDKVRQENEELIKRKEEEWIRRGGKSNTSMLPESSKDGADSVGTAWKTYAEKGLRAAVDSTPSMDVDEDEESDDDWAPEVRGSASPPPREDSQNSQDEGAEERDTDEAEGVPIVDDNAESEADEAGESRTRPSRRARAIVDSDSDGDSNNENKPVWAAGSSSLQESMAPHGSDQNDGDAMPPPRPPLVSVMMHRGSLSSLDEPTEDEGDKENNNMFDQSEDKENTVMMQSPMDLKRPPLGTKSSLFGLEDGVRSGLAISPGVGNPTGGDGDDEADDTDMDEKRKPLGEILVDDDLFTSPAKGPVTSSLTRRLQQDSPAVGTQFTSNFRSNPLINRKTSGFSQFSDDDEVGVDQMLPQPSFTKLFQSNTQHPVEADKPFGVLEGLDSSSLDEPPANGLNNLRKVGTPNGLALTQDLVAQPMFVAGEDLLRKAVSVFEKEQAYLLETAVRRPPQAQELYVNDLGFLTQTKPNNSSPEVYRPPPPSHPSTLYQTQSQKGPDDIQVIERQPLQTLSLSSVVDLDSPEREPRRRLMRRPTSPPRSNKKGAYQMSPPMSPSLRGRPQNAFGALARGAKPNAEKSKARLEKIEFIEAEAQESDEDDIFGFGIKKDDEEEGEDQDLDKTLETLVDDQEMDEDTVAAELVIEKYKEQEELDDQENEKLHQAAIHGELRNRKRNHGVGLDDSDEDSDEDEKNKRIRRAMGKRIKIGRDDIKQLGEHHATRSFFNVYKNDLVDNDNLDLSHLQDSQDVTMTTADEEIDENEDEPRGFISRDEIRQRVRELAQSEQQVDQPLDPNDVSWIDNSSEDESTLRVKSVSTTVRKTHPRRGVNTVDTEFDGATEPRKSRMEKACERNRMESWARVEKRSGNAGTGRSVGGAAVTGHSRAKLKTGGGSLRNSSAANRAPSDRGPSSRRSLTATPSVLAGVADRRGRFEQC